jgi:hypothetical protein
MRRPHYILIATVVVGLVLAACASPAASGEPGASSGSAPSAAAEASQGGGGGGGGGGDSGLTLPDGAWTAGHANATVSGDLSGTIEADLFAATSITDGGNTFLQYISSDGAQVAVAIYPNDVGVSVVSSDFSGGGGSTAGGQCEVSFSRSDDNAVEGTVHCEDAPMLSSTGTVNTLATLDVSFSATR